MNASVSLFVDPSCHAPVIDWASAASPGLVPYKTTAQKQTINLAPSAVADRRVNRLKRSVWASGHLHALAEPGFRPAVAWFVTLTYALAHAWNGDHISRAVKRFRNWCRSRNVPCRYTWVAEIQPRRLERTGEAVVHYHLLAWLPLGVSMPHWDRPTNTARGLRAPFWSHGMTETDKARSGVGYLMKYLSKLGELTRFPKNLRLYGIGGLNKEGRAVRSWFNLPQWAKTAHGVGELMRGTKGFIVRGTGEVLEPVWRVSRMPSGIVLTKLRDVPSRFSVSAIPAGEYPGAYSSFPRLAT